MPGWMTIAAMAVNSVLVVLFLVGGFFMTRSFLRKMDKDDR
jgi:uncharacterized protein YneF (UPF0154 family)